MAITETAATYIGISNENEFYSHHYLSEVFKGDIKQVLDGWQQRQEDEPDYVTPHQRLRGLARDYFVMRERIRQGLSSKEHIALQRRFFRQLLPVFGFSWQPQQLIMEDGFQIPVLSGVGVQEQPPKLLVLGAFDCSSDDLDPLSVPPHKAQFHGTLPVEAAWMADDWNHLITHRIYAQAHPPRWVLLLSDSQLLLLDRLKWNQNRLLRFNWDDLLGRKDAATLKATAVLLHQESLLPDAGVSLLDTLDENAHKQAFAVSEDLKYTLREAIELLGNEAAAYLIRKAKAQKQGIFSGGQALDADDLTRECLRYLYRLLFLFYIEARPDLGYVPLAPEVYRKGYSLESLRDLEMVRLTTEASRSGSFFHQSIQRLFSLIYQGYQGVDDKEKVKAWEGVMHNTFAIDRLDSHLFNPRGTPHLNQVVFRNDTLQQVIELMSLTRSPGATGRGHRKNKRRGRISYAQLGINQLGAVYEALLSYRGFFADRDLYEVKKADTHPDALETGYFVPAEDLELYTEDERVFDKDEHGHQQLRKYTKGTFIYRLAGRDRQQSASYYTPEVLTRTLVKYALKERIGETGAAGATAADDLLKLTLCKPFAAEDIDTLQFLSDRIDTLWAEHALQLRAHRNQTEDDIPVWPQPETTPSRSTSTAAKDRVRNDGIFNRNARNTSAYRVLKMAMDYWCALWFWPIEQAEHLPTREEFLAEIMLLLSGEVLEVQPRQRDWITEAEHHKQQAEQRQQSAASPPARQPGLAFPDRNSQPEIRDSRGRVCIEKLLQYLPRLQRVQKLAKRHRFFHWELTFADVFADNGGFDLILGNPPWLKVEWQEAGVLGDFHPLFNLRKFSATKLRDEREAAFAKYPALKHTWFAEYEQADATQAFLNAHQNYPLLEGQKANLYKCFLPQAWMLGSKQAVSGFLHPEGVYDDPKGGKFRAAIYPRLKAHFQFQNELNLFAEVDHHMKFSINVYAHHGTTSFAHLSNLFATTMVDACFAHNGEGAVPGIKDDHGKWNTAGHAHRIIKVTEKELTTFATLYDEVGTPAMQARLPALHARELMGVLDKFATQPKRLGDLQSEYYSTQHWNEVNAQNDGTIRRQTEFPESAEQWILSGPHFFVGNPCYKTPRAQCTLNSHYDILNLTDLPDDYLPRTNYIPACSEAEYRARTPRVPWIDEGETETKRVTEYYRLIASRALSQSGERTLQGAIMPRFAAHIDGIFSNTLKSSDLLVLLAGLWASSPLDFFVKSTGKSDFRGDLAKRLPIPDFTSNIRKTICLRTLLLNCITSHFADLWRDCWLDDFTIDHWTKSDPRLPNAFFHNLTPKWQRNCALRTDYARRQALVEIDVLATLALGLTLQELLTLYRVQFPVMRQYEADTFYDANGRIVFTVSKGLTGVGLPRKATKNVLPCILHHPDGREESQALGWVDIRDLPAGYEIIRTITDNTLPGGPREKQLTYTAPFDRCNREDDYRRAWAVFEERKNYEKRAPFGAHDATTF